ncbi:MAG TPA: glycosyltransferase family 8 protein [Clostridiales bacterium]|nr:glycosyltransferase family 8 protein [Clostridiales bacterium]
MNILVTINSNYLYPLKVMLWSLFFNNPNRQIDIYLLHSSLTDDEIEGLRKHIGKFNQKLFEIKIDDCLFDKAPVVMHYSKEMYYRLLAHRCLPDSLDRILYLDPDILVINSLEKLYYMDINDYLFAAAFHDRIPVKEINRLRLKAYEVKEYYNSGVLLMNLPLLRERANEEEIFEFVESKKRRLILPDQDVLNALFGKNIKKIDEIKYNYDTRYYQYYKLVSNGLVDMNYVIKNTSILHFCGKKKPWRKAYSGKFYSLYKHYEVLAFRD